MNSMLLTDGYKLSHANHYPEGTSLIFDNFTPRSDHYAPEICKGQGVVVFGPQMAFKWLHNHFEENFFMTVKRKELAKSGTLVEYGASVIGLKKSIMNPLKRKLDNYINGDYDMSRIEALWDLGYLPISVRALEEGSICPIRVPMLTIHNTLPDFFWLPNYLETILSQLLWKPMTSASIALGYKKIIKKWVLQTTGSTEIDFLAHDFSMRGLDSEYATMASGLGHATSFSGSDSLPVLDAAEYFYNETGFVVGGVPATEHSVMCAGGEDNELETFSRLMDIHPTGYLSVVSDTWDLWYVVGPGGICEQLKDKIMSREGKLVIRPDSGDPVDILCGLLPIHESEYMHNVTVETMPRGYWCQNRDNFYTEKGKKTNSNEIKGVIELLWDTFGGTEVQGADGKMYKVLDSHIGTIYGDSITHERCEEICKRLAAKGFAASNVVFGVGSYTYQYNTRDTFGFAMKATYVEKNCTNCFGTGENQKNDIGYEKCKFCNGQSTHGYEIFKDPITDSGMKKSAKGLIAVNQNEDGTLVLTDQVTWTEVLSQYNMLKPLYEDGKLLRETTLTKIREKLNEKI